MAEKQPAPATDGGGDPALMAALARGDWTWVLDFAKEQTVEALKDLEDLIRENEGLLMRSNIYGRIGQLALINMGKSAREAEKEVKSWRRLSG